MKVESKAQLNSLRMSPQKVRLVANLIRGISARDAQVQLQFSRKAAAKPLFTLLNSAVANAVHNHHVDPKSLVVSTIFVNDGAVLKRWMPRAQGRATPLRKRSSHITIVLTGDANEKTPKEAVAIEVAAEAEVVPQKEVKKTRTRKPRAKAS